MVNLVNDNIKRTWEEILNEFSGKQVILDVVEGTVCNCVKAIVLAYSDECDDEFFDKYMELSGKSDRPLVRKMASRNLGFGTGVLI